MTSLITTGGVGGKPCSSNLCRALVGSNYGWRLRITQYPMLDGTFKDHFQPLALHSTTQNSNPISEIAIQNHCPGEPVPCSSPSGEELFPNIQCDPPLTQLHVISSGPVTVTECRAHHCSSIPCEEMYAAVRPLLSSSALGWANQGTSAPHTPCPSHASPLLQPFFGHSLILRATWLKFLKVSYTRIKGKVL